MRTSRQREAILQVVRGTKRHPTAEWIYGEVRKRVPGISLGTVYRNLKLLCESGEVRLCERIDGVSRYDGCTMMHQHFCCESCGAMVDIQEPADLELDRRVAATTGLRIRSHVLEFRGLCMDCQNPPATSGRDEEGVREDTEEAGANGSSNR